MTLSPADPAAVVIHGAKSAVDSVKMYNGLCLRTNENALAWHRHSDQARVQELHDAAKIRHLVHAVDQRDHMTIKLPSHRWQPA